MTKIFLHFIVTAIALATLGHQTNVFGQDSSNPLKDPYCFYFTWLGPKWNAESPYLNQTCKGLLKGAKGIPCFHPLVVTNDSGIPDTDYMWEMYKDTPTKVGCRLVPGEVCAMYSYTYNGAIENITYLCSKVNIENGSVVTSGCFVQKSGGREIEVCLCESTAGQVPCNSSDSLALTFLILMLSTVFIFVLMQHLGS